jgi:signal transduction histidine kinase
MGAVVQFRAKDQSEEAADTILLAAVMEACTEGLAIIESGRVLHANRAFAQTFGYLEGPEVEGRALADFIPESLFLFSPDPESAMQAAQPSACACSGVRRDGEERQVLAASALFRPGQRELRVVNLCEMNQRKQPGSQAPDLRTIEARKLELQKLELQKFESQRLETLGRVVGGVAHDFNNLLTGILLYCDLLIRGLEAKSPLRTYVEEIRKAGGHSSGLIQQLLSAAQSRAGETLAHSWSEVISGMQNFLVRMLGENIELVAELDPQAAAVRMSDTAMRQIALNLLLNARDAMPNGGRITLTARNCVECVDTPSGLFDGYVEFTVTDSGCGMDAATRIRLFEPFFTTKAVGHGNGLGLATVQRIVSEAKRKFGGTKRAEQGYADLRPLVPSRSESQTQWSSW